jgi:hypothetical protein
VDVLSEEQVAAGLLVTRGYRVLFVLGCSALPEPVRDAIVEFVKNGGALVQDYSGAANEPYTSLFNDRVEGPGTAGPSYIMINDLLVRRGVSYTVRARAEALRPGKGDRVLAVYEDGRPAVITFRVGKGNVFRFGSMIGIDYGGWQPGVFEYKEPRFLTYISHQEDLRKLIDTIVRRSGVVPPAETDNPDVEVAVLQKGDEFKLLVINHRDEGVRTNIRVPVVGDAYAVVDVRANKELHAEMLDGHLSFEVDLGRLDGRELRIVPAT